MKNYAAGSGVSSRVTHQMEVIPGRESEMAKNSAGGVSFVLDTFGYLRRFLILGTEGSTYYTSEAKLTAENAKNSMKAVSEDGLKVLKMVTEISDLGLAKSNDPAIFVLALCFAYGNVETKKEAEKSLLTVCRIGTHILTFVSYVKKLIGWNRRLSRAVSSWYLTKPYDKLEFQMVKYQNRSGFTHHDVLHLCHPKPPSSAYDNLFFWAKKGESKINGQEGQFLRGYAEAHANKDDIPRLVKIIGENKLTFEMLPTECLKDKRIWEALLPHMGYSAMVRNLGRFSSIGLIEKFGDNRKLIIDTLTNQEIVSKSRIHPLSILMALKVYRSGRGLKGSLAWSPDGFVSSALDSAFYMAFGNVKPTGMRTMLCLDVSKSMGWTNIAGTAIKPSEASVAMALVTAKVEKDYEIMAFSNRLRDLKITPKDNLESAMAKTQAGTFGSTDCSLPMVWATEQRIKDIGGFVVYTDNETYIARIHPSQALKQYRNQFGPKAKLAVCGMTATQFTIADPQDSGMLDLVGMDSSMPQVLSDFIAGNI